ncbi:MAG: 3D domain-containing protein [Candidatus Peregrinibacteria bacterium]|nr:3D domain-containing protein [Candidatus Peregrinibacteria bacterium]MDZ4244303.1 3D domain-containing protein [Candidatus Gracilibacteria bacterium]
MGAESNNQDRSAEMKAHLLRIEEEVESEGGIKDTLFEENEETEKGIEDLKRFYEIKAVFDEYMSRHDSDPVIERQIDVLNDPIKIREIIELGLIPRIVTFDVSAYYSPIEGQRSYGKTSKDEGTNETMYDEDGNKIYRQIKFGEAKALNGKGEVGKSGMSVFRGMVAAPDNANYPYGTKIYLPGIGMCDVQDRGGAIVKAGGRGNEFDRLDVWMGLGDAARENARDFGRDNFIEALVFGPREDIEAEIEGDSWLDRDPSGGEMISLN